MSKHIDPMNFFVVYHWMSSLQITSEDAKGNPKKDNTGNVLKQPLSGVAKELYAIIYRWSLGKAGCCYHSYAQFAEITGASKSTVIRALDCLCRNDLIIKAPVHYNSNKNGKAQIVSVRYRVNAHKIEELGIDIPKELNINSVKPTMWNDFIRGEHDINGEPTEGDLIADPNLGYTRVF